LTKSFQIICVAALLLVFIGSLLTPGMRDKMLTSGVTAVLVNVTRHEVESRGFD
jgi:hypothetical protein